MNCKCVVQLRIYDIFNGLGVGRCLLDNSVHPRTALLACEFCHGTGIEAEPAGDGREETLAERAAALRALQDRQLILQAELQALQDRQLAIKAEVREELAGVRKERDFYRDQNTRLVEAILARGGDAAMPTACTSKTSLIIDNGVLHFRAKDGADPRYADLTASPGCLASRVVVNLEASSLWIGRLVGAGRLLDAVLKPTTHAVLDLLAPTPPAGDGQPAAVRHFFFEARVLSTGHTVWANRSAVVSDITLSYTTRIST